MKQYDVIVIGAGHAGIEASYAAGGLGVHVLLLTLDVDAIGRLSCNPAVGGVAKGHLVKEVDACGGLIARIADSTALNYRRLNKSKGKAVWATRVQVDRFQYPHIARSLLEAQKNVDIVEAKVTEIIVKRKKAIGVMCDFGEPFFAKAVIVCAGTFLKSTIHIGLSHFSGGRLNEASSDALFDSLKKHSIRTKHFKTGTCARLDKRSLDFSKMKEQLPEYDVEPFSFSNTKTVRKQLKCFITYTNKKTHTIILKNLNQSPLYTGKIKSRGVRYCPSLEDKIVKFKEKDAHQIFIEPEGRDSIEVYPNGISTSLPLSVQEEFIHSIAGLERARIVRPGYGIEHGCIDARQLYATLELKAISGLYFSGQVNGTTGYEEAAAQGLVAGVNAAFKIKGKNPAIFSRKQSFIGVLIDDLVHKGTDEPYRMFTSRSEYRLSLREGNADLRLMPFAYQAGLINKAQYGKMIDKKETIDTTVRTLRTTKVKAVSGKITLFDIVKQPKNSFDSVGRFINIKKISLPLRNEIETVVKYQGFIERERQSLKAFERFKKVKIPKTFDINAVSSLSKEIREKLVYYAPATLEDALQISGITPAAVLTIYNFLNKRKS